MTRIIIYVEGGNVQTVKADTEDLTISVLDADILDYPIENGDSLGEFKELENEFDELPYEVY